MKTIVLILSFLSLTAQASPRTDYFDQYQKNNNVRCPISACAMDDYGHTYTQVCNGLRQRQFDRSKQGVLLIHDKRGQPCYCGCDLGWEARARAIGECDEG